MQLEAGNDLMSELSTKRKVEINEILDMRADESIEVKTATSFDVQVAEMNSGLLQPHSEAVCEYLVVKPLVLDIPVEPRQTENIWVPPRKRMEGMGVDEQVLFYLGKTVCSILNKLTPQKFKPLLNQMIELKVDNAAKLELVVSLIHEKAVFEPMYSAVYANMCRVLTDNFNKVPTSNESNAPMRTFKKVLLNKCQIKFQKESSDEKKLEEDRNNTFDKEEDWKARLEELDYNEVKNRRRTFGNIRFIGELCNVRLVSESVMHDCINKLLNVEKRESLEHQFECLCKLLTIVGKKIDHPQAKRRMDQYFEQINAIIERREIPSRIKFALKDVLDLRENNWVPRQWIDQTENIWVRPRERMKKMGVEEKVAYNLRKSVCSILNKLTPQKFKPLLNQMIELKVDNAAKLELVVSLIHEKAVFEPMYSAVYANMCRVLTDSFKKVPTSNGPNAPTTSFRKVLLNKCQTKFERKSSDEKELEEDRNKTFEKEEDMIAHLEVLNNREVMNRKRTLGNIRFIGELHRVKMISEPIMHNCIYKLLKPGKPESLGHQLQCLCKLLTTLGKTIDRRRAKPRIDQYFEQINKIIEERKLSSKIKFVLKDVIELRENNWVPRHGDRNPKTIDQIHREASPDKIKLNKRKAKKPKQK